MSPPPRRGACPTLAAPMLTGDGWLARLRVEALTPAQLVGLGQAAGRFGNGRIEVTARGSLQVRGLTRASAADLGVAVADLGIAPEAGVSVLNGPLAGLDPGEIADPRPLASDIRRLAARLALAPKVSVVVDGGGALPLAAVPADLRLTAGEHGWSVAAAAPGGSERMLALCDSATAVGVVVGMLKRMAGEGARARDLDLVARPETPLAARIPAVPIGRFALRSGVAQGFGLPFGQAEGSALAALAAVAVAEFRPAPGRALIAVAPDDDGALLARARGLGFVVDPEDARLSVVACSGAPACRSAHLATRALAEDLARERPDLLASGRRLHLSGCAKRCAQPMGPAVTLVATAGGCEITADGAVVPADLRDFLMQRVAEAGMAV